MTAYKSKLDPVS